MKKIALKKILYGIVCILTGALLISTVFIIGASDTFSNLGLINLNLPNPFLYLPILFFVSLIIGAYTTYLLKPKNFVNFLLTGFAICSIIILINVLITIYANLNNIMEVGSPYPDVVIWDAIYHFQILIYLSIFYFYIPSVLPGFFVGGFFTFRHIKKKKNKSKNSSDTI